MLLNPSRSSGGCDPAASALTSRSGADASERALLALRCVGAASLQSVLDGTGAQLAALVVMTRRPVDGGEVPLLSALAAVDPAMETAGAAQLHAAVSSLSRSGHAGELTAFVGRLAQAPLFREAGAEPVTVIRKPPLSAVVLRSAARAREVRPPDVAVLFQCSRQLHAALGSFELCQAAAAAGHELAFAGVSEAFLRLDEQTRAIAAHSDVPVLIAGERGAGKEAVAYALHYYSARRRGPFGVVNAGALQPELYASELFGCRRGSYTGATDDRTGRFEAAEGGTLFFDEITEMPPQVYAGLLRAFDHGEIQKLGDTRARRIDTRIVAATNRDLDGLVSDGRFPADLYDRVSALHIAVPPLRDRPADIPLLASFYLKRYCRSSNGHPTGNDAPCEGCRTSGRALCLDDDVMAAFGRYHWPGNVRELKNVIVRLKAACSGGRISARDVGRVIGARTPSPVQTIPAEQTLDGIVRLHICSTLQRAGWNKSAAARTLGVPLSTLVSKMKRLQIPQRDGAGCDRAQPTLRSGVGGAAARAVSGARDA
jgi:DNA-binding NtrC family response regulator